MREALPFLQIIVSVFLVAAILLQRGGTAMGSAFGGGEGFHSEKRGVEKKLFSTSIVLGIFFIALALLNLLL